MEHLYIKNCNFLTNIYIIEGLIEVKITNCKHQYNYYHTNIPNEYSIYAIQEFNNMNKIKRWYKRLKFSKKLWMYAELVIMDSMNPHKENNKYLEQYINSNVYN
jgi:hypothetical protein